MALGRQFRVYITTSFQADEDATGYVLPTWGAGQLIAEPSLMAFQAADLPFTFVDRDTAKPAQYWATRLMTSTTTPTVRVVDVTDIDAEPLPLFFGWIERNQYRRQGDVFTGFVAVSQLSHADRLDARCLTLNGTTATSGTAAKVGLRLLRFTAWDTGKTDLIQAGIVPGDRIDTIDGQYIVAYVENGTDVTVTADLPDTLLPPGGATSVIYLPVNTYSGLAAPLMRRLLREIGNVAPEAATGNPDVRIDDYYLGAGQDKTDWNHVLRLWASAGADPASDNMLSDFVPSVSGDRLGFICIHGKLYRVDIGKPSGGGAANGLRVAEITKVPYGETAAISAGLRLFPYTLYDGTPCLCVVQGEPKRLWVVKTDPWLDPAVSTGTALAQTGLSLSRMSAIPMLSWMTVVNLVGQALSNATKRFTATPTTEQMMMVKSVHVLSIGDGTNNPVTGVGMAVDMPVPAVLFGDTVPVDSFTVSQRQYSGLSSPIYCAQYSATTNRTQARFAWHDIGGWSLGNAGAPISGRPAGGMAAWQNGGKVVIGVGMDFGFAVRVDGDNNATVDVKLSRSPSRFVTMFPVRDSGDLSFFVGNDDGSRWYKLNYTGSLIQVAFRNISLTPSSFKLVSVGLTPMVGPNGRDGIPCVYKVLDSENSEYLYGGWIYATPGGVLRLDADAVCEHPIPGARSGDFRPPGLFYDGSVWRFVLAQTTVDGKRLYADLLLTGSYALPYIHADLLSEKVSARHVQVNVAQSFGCYLRLIGLAAPTVAAGVKVATRHSFLPGDAGSVNYSEHVVNPQVIGTEYYLGARASCYGEEVKVGSTEIAHSRFVYQLQGAFLQPIWARALGGWLVARYPERATDYPLGRRLIAAELRAKDDADEFEVWPTYDDLYQQLTFGGFRTGEVNTLILGVGFNRQTMHYGLLALEYEAHDVDWTTNEGDVTAEALEVIDPEPGEPPEPVTAPVRLVTWDVRALPTNAYESNPADGPHAYAFTLDLPQGLTLTGYRYQLLESGTVQHGQTTIEIWTDNGGVPGLAVDGTRATATHDGIEPGMPDVPLDAGDEVVLLPGLYWLMVNTDRDDENEPPIIAPPIAWQDGLTVSNRALVMPFSPMGFPTEWDAVTDAEVQRVPLVYAQGRA